MSLPVASMSRLGLRRTSPRNRSAIIVLLILALTACFSDEISSIHNSRADAVSTIERGWIPSALPESATKIHETHNLDTNVGHGAFAFSAASADAFKVALIPLPQDKEIRGTPTRDDLEKSGYTFYSCEDFVIAVNWQDHQGQFWLGSLH